MAEYSPTPDDDFCEQESEDWAEMLDSLSTDNFQSSSRVVPIKKPTPRKDVSLAWKGIPVKVLKKMPDCEEKLGPLKGSESHVVLFQTPYEYKEQSPPKPYAQYKDKWDHDHVRMPCSSQNEFPVQEKHGKKIVRRWDIITRALSGDIKDINDLEAAIISYSHRYFEKWDFQTLHYFFTKDLQEQECREFFSKTMKKMQKLAQKLPHLCSHPIPLLRKGQSKSVTFSQQQIACLLANAFFCTFPQRNDKQCFSEFPSINFSSLFTGKPDSVKMEKLRCILHYFTRVCEKNLLFEIGHLLATMNQHGEIQTPCGTVTFTRIHKSEFPNWDKMETQLSGLHVSSEGTIEDDGEGMLQMDFANKFVGGGVLDNDCGKEEIRFLICPEMIISRLITEELDFNEVLVMRGCKRFSDYDGYSSTFKWKGSYTAKTPSEQESEDWAEMLDSMSTDNFQSSSRVVPIKKPTPKKDGSQAWKGIPVKVLKKMPECEEKLGPLKGSESHVVLFQTPYEYKEQSPPKPYAQYKDKWDHYHVQMSCSNQNEFPVQEKHGKKIVRRWDIITRALSGDIKDINDLEAAIISYSHRYFEKWDFQTLHYFFTKDLQEQECREFFSKTMKKMQKLAQKLPHLCSHPIPLLRKGQSKSVTFSQQQIACLLANAFFCTFPQRNAKQRFSEFPSINFSSLFTGKPDSVKMEKLRCILHYFTRVCEKNLLFEIGHLLATMNQHGEIQIPCGTVTITRMHKSESCNWDKMDTHLSRLHVSSEGTIEDDGEGMLQVDFANKFVGGGVLDNDCQQEEIRFLICPEMIISRLITEELVPNEALVMRGCERFSDYDGYSSTFKWKGSYTDKTPRDKWGRIYCEVVAIDALVFQNYKSQFNHDFVLRELSKAYCGFFRRLPQEHLPAVCTGNWGCGAFGGDRRLKALIQLMAAAHARRDVCYFTLDDEKLRDDLHEIHSYLTMNQHSIGNIMDIIKDYRKNVILKSQGKPEMNIFEFILKTFDGSLENTDEDSHSSKEMRFLKESGSESSSSSSGAADGVTLDVNWESETNTASLQSTNKSSTSRQHLQETQIQKLDMSTAKSPNGLALPSHWAPIVKDVVCVVLDPNDRKQTIRDEYAKVANHFEKSMTNAEIKSIKKVQNVLLWEHYALRKKQMEGKSGMGNVNEMHLYHGTIPDTVELICEENFDFRIAGSRVGALYGQGTYFALEAKFSDCYAHIDGNNHKFMFVAQVLVGKICLGKAEYKKPPYLDEGNKKKGTYDTCVNNVDRPSVFCVFDRNQYYPEYIIEYET